MRSFAMVRGEIIKTVSRGRDFLFALKPCLLERNRQNFARDKFSLYIMIIMYD